MASAGIIPYKFDVKFYYFMLLKDLIDSLGSNEPIPQSSSTTSACALVGSGGQQDGQQQASCRSSSMNPILAKGKAHRVFSRIAGEDETAQDYTRKRGWRVGHLQISCQDPKLGCCSHPHIKDHICTASLALSTYCLSVCSSGRKVETPRRSYG
jgi:hypothetical protein